MTTQATNFINYRTIAVYPSGKERTVSCGKDLAGVYERFEDHINKEWNTAAIVGSDTEDPCGFILEDNMLGHYTETLTEQINGLGLARRLRNDIHDSFRI